MLLLQICRFYKGGHYFWAEVKREKRKKEKVLKNKKELKKTENKQETL